MKQNNHGKCNKTVHYSSYNNTIKEPLRYLTEVTLKSLKENREIRQKPGGEKYHYQQCAGIPDALNSNYYLHPECSRKFMYAKTSNKWRCKDDDVIKSKIQKTTRSSQSIRTADKRGIFPGIFMTCKKMKIKVTGNDYYTTRILTQNAEETMKKEAQPENNEGMLLEIHEVDLIAKEFKKHNKCYRDYTRLIYENLEQEKNPIYSTGDYDAVVKII